MLALWLVVLAMASATQALGAPQHGTPIGASQHGAPWHRDFDEWQMDGRSQDDETLHFLSATLGSHMVLQRAPQTAIVWGFTSPGAITSAAPNNPLSTASDTRSHRHHDHASIEC